MTGQPPEPDEPLSRLVELTSELIDTIPGPLRRVEISAAGAHLEIEWSTSTGAGAQQVSADSIDAGAGAAGAAVGPGAGAAVAAVGPGADPVSAGLHLVLAPMVGTFYRAREPGAEPFVCEGQEVTAGQQIAVVEAMKMMMPVEADVAGEVVEVLASDAMSVEFGTPLIAIATR